MEIEKIQGSIDAEMADALESRSSGNEGRARVCARRAAGLAIGYYREQCGETQLTDNALHLLSWFVDLQEIPEELRQASQRLTVHVTPSHQLPHTEDPLEDARTIIEAILSGKVWMKESR
ncbi:MAG: hypothetical protein GTO18_09705 [Anaerolineales bacterium]|nr:hypothetical protein [Anaerolineales bacterium]